MCYTHCRTRKNHRPMQLELRSMALYTNVLYWSITKKVSFVNEGLVTLKKWRNRNEILCKQKRSVKW